METKEIERRYQTRTDGETHQDEVIHEVIAITTYQGGVQHEDEQLRN